MKNPNVRILLIALVLVACVAAAALLVKPGEAPAPTQAADASLPAPKAYLRIQAGSEVLPLIPMAEGGEYTVEQGSGRTNIVRTTETGAVMHFSTCENQSCVHQGEASLENRDSRVLGGMIICLPNEVMLEVLTPEEAGMEEAEHE